MEKDDIDYNEYKYKSFIWHEDYKEDIRKKKKQKVKENTKKQKNKRIDKEGLFVVVVMFLCFSSTIVLSNFAVDGTLKLLSKEQSYFAKYYLLSIATFTDKSVATISADELINIGGAGYIYGSDKFYLIASAYQNYEDAEKVQGRLDNNDTDILEIALSQPCLSWVDSKDEDCVSNTLEYIKTAVSTLINISVSLEKEDILLSGVISQINTLSDEIKYLTTDFEKLTQYKNNDEYIKISSEIKVTLAMLENLKNSELTSLQMLSSIRFTFVAIILGAKNMLENI